MRPAELLVKALRLVSKGLLACSSWLLGVPARVRRLPRWAWLSRSDESNWRFAWLFTLPYVAYLIWAHAHHVPWRDEAHPWIVARQAEGFWDVLMGDRRYDGHPPGWYWALYISSCFTSEVWGMHATTVLLSSVSMLLFLRWAPFPRPLRLMLGAGYMLAYEYGVMSRNYTLGVLGAFAFASCLRPLRPRTLLMACALIMLALSSVYGVVMALCLLMVLLAESTRLASARGGTWALLVERRAAIAAAVVLGTIVFSLWASHPPDPNPGAPGIRLENINADGMKHFFHRIVWTVLPLRIDGDASFWYAPEQVWRNYPQLLEWLAVALPVVMALCLVASPVELVVFCLGVVGFSVLQLAVYAGGVRHWTHTYLLFLVLCWTLRRRKPLRRGWLIPTVLTVAGAFNLQAEWVAARTASKYEFSGAAEVAARLDQPDLAQVPIFGTSDWAMPAIMVHLSRDYLSCETEEVNQTLVFHSRRVQCSPKDVFRRLEQLLERYDALAVITAGPLYPPRSRFKSQLLLQTHTPTLTVENFYLYRVELKPDN